MTRASVCPAQPNSSTSDPTDGRFLSKAECLALAQHLSAFRAGEGEAGLRLESSWTGQTRYTRNAIRTSGDVLRNELLVVRDLDGAYAEVAGNQIDAASLLAAIRRAERIARLTGTQTGGAVFQESYPIPDALARDAVNATPGGPVVGRNGANATSSPPPAVGSAESVYRALGLTLTASTPESYDSPTLFFNSTYAMDPEQRATTLAPLAATARTAGVMAAGYLEARARGRAVMDTWGRVLYYPSTEARYSVTVRSLDGTGSGWAGVMWNDWTRVNPEKLQAIALQKCLDSRNPVRVEPGRYTTILEPQAVHQLFWKVFMAMAFTPIIKIDSRLQVTQDPMDPDCGSMPFDVYGNPYHKATWYKDGVLERTPASRFSAAYRLYGTSAPTPTEEMIASTQRGILVTRFRITGGEMGNIITGGEVNIVHGYTRDGTWLIENGKITHPVKNMRFRISLDGMLNNVEHVGAPQRVYTPEYPDDQFGGFPDYAAVVPPLKVRDFSFVATSDAV